MKLSDALRGAADRAPVDDATISVDAATGRVRRRRAVRAGSTGLVGAGAVAVLAFGAIGQLGPLSGDDAQDSLAGGDANVESAMDGEMGAPAMAEEDSSAGDTRLAEPWMCGSTFDPETSGWSWGDTSGVEFEARAPEQDGQTWSLPQTLTALRPVDLVGSPDYVVVWDGIVVGRMISPDPVVYGPADEMLAPQDGPYERLDPESDFPQLEQWVTLDAVNCWDGSPLPAGDYEVHSAWTLAYAADTAPGGESGEAPTEPSPAASPDVTDMPVEEGADAAALPGAEDAALWFRVAAGPVTLTIDGEPVDDPFGAYLGGDQPGEPVPLPEPIEPQPLPDGYLTPDIARELFEANRVDGSWEMAAGTQRVVKVSDSRSDNPDGDWQANFYGCVWDDSVDGGFPERSAELDLLDVSVSVPSSISVSYGFVVDGNPLMNSTVRNASEYTIPGFWSGPSPQLFLVRDGVVVAEAYPLGLDDQMAAIARDRAVVDDADDMALTIAPETGGTLAPGAQLSGRYLWRDVTACGTGGQIAAGSYTVLAAQSISLSNEGQVVMYSEGDEGSIGGGAEPGILLPEPAIDVPESGAEESGFGSGSASGSADMVEPAIAPAPDMEYDWLELQVYTSLGTISVR
ncbi:hypothetical protein [Demequina activiva]|uniref:Uncharacterized protein n=1 Tax=Demequina activiva TaxID=1582364 RepID=A0A919UFV3_9MICO|nr:hypothetical protein [Demequina activiva]GIG53829.1 hypothetical protein Dac01nite_05810 [Demequina activiva]